MKRQLRMIFLSIWLLVVVMSALLGLDTISLVAGIARIIVAPWVSQRCLRFTPDVLTAAEECIAGLLTSAAVCSIGVFWITYFGYQVSLYTLLVRVSSTVAISFGVIGIRRL